MSARLRTRTIVASSTPTPTNNAHTAVRACTTVKSMLPATTPATRGITPIGTSSVRKVRPAGVELENSSRLISRRGCKAITAAARPVNETVWLADSVA
jgi:hypothetical protein